MNLTWSIITTAAIVDSINPCAISVLLLTIGFLFSLNKLRSYIIRIGLVYIFGIYITYLLIGLGVLRALSLFGFPHVLAKIGAIALMATAGINLGNILIPRFPIKLKIPDSAHPHLAKFIQKATIPSFLVLGVLVGLFEFPCTGGPYLLILGLLHDQSTFIEGLKYLMYYNLIFVAPLVGILIISSRPGLLQKVDFWRKKHSKMADIITSLIMLVLAGIIFVTS
jgi:cytochrome c-type biogenesis protein